MKQEMKAKILFLFLVFFLGKQHRCMLRQFRRRSKAELGFENAITVGYAQDHEGYLTDSRGIGLLEDTKQI